MNTLLLLSGLPYVIGAVGSVLLVINLGLGFIVMVSLNATRLSTPLACLVLRVMSRCQRTFLNASALLIDL